MVTVTKQVEEMTDQELADKCGMFVIPFYSGLFKVMYKSSIRRPGDKGFPQDQKAIFFERRNAMREFFIRLNEKVEVGIRK